MSERGSGPRSGPLGWSNQMRDELAQLPETAANIREASENLKTVSAQLVDVSAMLTKIVRAMDATGVSEGLQRVEKVGRDLEQVRRMMTVPRNLDQAAKRLDDIVAGLGSAVLGQRRPDADDTAAGDDPSA